MSSYSRLLAEDAPARIRPPLTLKGLPILYEDDKDSDLGEANEHVFSDETLHICLLAHFAGRRNYRVFSNLNLYYDEEVSPLPYVSPDCMIVKPRRPLGKNPTSYRVGRDGPAPLFVAEVLSERSWEQRDLDEKVVIYGTLRIPEYVVVDVTGELLSKRLVLMRLRQDGTWKQEKDSDGGVTSRLGFRLTIEADERLCVWNAETGERYLRPFEAQAAERARLKAERRIHELEAEVARLRKVRGKRKS